MLQLAYIKVKKGNLMTQKFIEKKKFWRVKSGNS